MYDNQKTVDKIANELNSIDESLVISSYGLIDNKVISVETSVMQKGNAKIIKQLESLGWNKTTREKVRTDCGVWSNQYAGYVMKIRMQKML